MDLTPEEKLLRVIERPTDAGSKKIVNELRQESFGSHRHKIKELLFSIRSRISVAAFLKACAGITLTTVRVFLIAIAGILTALLFVNFLLVHRWINVHAKAVERDKAKNEKITVAKVNGGSFLPVDTYAAEAKAHNVFSLLPKGIEPAVKEELFNEVQTMAVVGILWEAKPQVMIEDGTTKQTVILYEGDKIGKFTVKKIYRDHIILQWGTYEWEKR